MNNKQKYNASRAGDWLTLLVAVVLLLILLHDLALVIHVLFAK